MSLQITTNINVDFYDKKYIMLNAKQYDSYSRWISIACYNQGSFFAISPSEHIAYIRYKKADGNVVLNICRIGNGGEVLVELTEQMLSVGGICYVDLIIVNKGNAIINVDTCEVTTIDGSSVLSTMAFCVNVYEAAVDNSLIESEYETNALNALLEKANADYKEVYQLAKSWAVGTGNIARNNDEIDNAKYYSNLSKSYAMGNTNGIRTNEDIDNAKYYSEQSSVSADNAHNSEINASNSVNLAMSYAIGGTGIRENEDENNAKYYCEIVKTVVNGLNSGFIPMGTITFSELATAEKATGFTYNISDDFITDETFAEGAGKSYTAGTNVYCRSDGLWDCFGGAASIAATVEEVKEYLSI